MHKRFKKLRRRSRRLRNRFGLYELLRTLLNKMGLETPHERKFKNYISDRIGKEEGFFITKESFCDILQQ